MGLAERVQKIGQSQVDSVMKPYNDMASIRDQQDQQAKDYRANLGEYQQQQANTAGNASRQRLAASIAGVNKNASARGALYGGMRQGMELDARARNAADLNRTIQGINTRTEDTANTLENNAINTGMNYQNALQNRMNAAYNAQLAESDTNGGLINKGVGGVLKGLGSL